LVRPKGEVVLTDRRGAFAWYELLTTDAERARDFYERVVGWRTEDASTAALPYAIFRAGSAEVGGLMELPTDARRMGATPRWVGYLAVDDIDARVERLRRPTAISVGLPSSPTHRRRLSAWWED
jgi:predicted enzyme related to lactoylglutathione lyase